MESQYQTYHLPTDAIPEEVVTKGAPDLGPALGKLTDDVALDAPISILRRYSLIDQHAETHTMAIHRLVQAVLVDGMDSDTQRAWAERAVRAVNRVFPDVEFKAWQSCQRYLPHALVCAESVEQSSLVLPEAARLFHQAGSYLGERGQFSTAETLFKLAIVIRERVLGPEDPEVARSLNSLAGVYLDEGQYE